MTKKGTNELVHLLMDIESMVDISLDEATHSNDTSRPKIFKRKPTICADNFFFDNAMCEWIGKKGYGAIGTTARNVLPDGIKKKYLHLEKHAPGCPCSKVARFMNPIVTVKNYDGYQRVHVSFQSSSSTNLLNQHYNCQLPQRMQAFC